MSEKHLYANIFTGYRTYWESKGHTGVVLVSRFDCLFSVIPSLHCLQTTSAYTLDLGRLAV